MSYPLIARFVIVMLSTLCVAVPLAADDRPTELPYHTPGPIPLLDATYQREAHQVVVITGHALRPKRIVIEEGERVAWESLAPAASIVVFEREVARDMICHSLVNFRIEDDEVRSGRIHAGEVASFCELKPGRYRYKVVRPDPSKNGSGARRRMDGEIVVEPRRS